MTVEYEEHLLHDDGRIPNNPRLPLLTYRRALTGGDLRSGFMRRLGAGWGGAWVGGVFSYHHYHSTAHEVLCVVGGEARLELGGEAGISVEVAAGDALVIPAGVGHRDAGSSREFAVIGAYPEGQSWDLLTGRPEERPQALENIGNVPLPETDPISGRDGPLVARWGL